MNPTLFVYEESTKGMTAAVCRTCGVRVAVGKNVHDLTAFEFTHICGIRGRYAKVKSLSPIRARKGEAVCLP